MAKAKKETDQALPAEQFTYGGKSYIIVKGGIVPGFGKLTAGELAIHTDAQKYLVEEAKGNTLIQEVVA